jgi:hypothetical protein
MSFMQETFEIYSKMTGHGTEQKALAAHDKYGLNKFEVPVPPFAELLKEHLMAPFFVFQVRVLLERLYQCGADFGVRFLHMHFSHHEPASY